MSLAEWLELLIRRSEAMSALLLVILSLGKLSQQNAVGQPVDIASSAYQYRTDRALASNPPESFIAVKYFAHQPLNSAFNPESPEVKECLTSFLWEEIRPVQTLELTWPVINGSHLSSDSIIVTALVNNGASSSWWNNLMPVRLDIQPTVSQNGKTSRYAIGQNVCGLVVSAKGNRGPARDTVPEVHVYAPDAWKSMNVELEWGFDRSTKGKDYSGRLETYDAMVSDVHVLPGDTGTSINPTYQDWSTRNTNSSRHGLSMNLMYMGTAKWRKQQEYTTQADDVARCSGYAAT